MSNVEVPQDHPIAEMIKPFADPVYVSASFDEFGNPKDVDPSLLNTVSFANECDYESLQPVVAFKSTATPVAVVEEKPTITANLLDVVSSEDSEPTKE